jgi:hypothetical protein
MERTTSIDGKQSVLTEGNMAYVVSQWRTVKLEDTSSNLELSEIAVIGEQQSAVAKAIAQAAKPLCQGEITLSNAQQQADEMLWQALDGAYQVLLEAEEDQKAFDAKCAAYGIKRTARQQSRFYLVLRVVHAAAHWREPLERDGKNGIGKRLEQKGRNFARDNARLLDAIHDSLEKEAEADPGERVIRIEPGTIAEMIRKHGSVRATIRALTSKVPATELNSAKRDDIEKKVEEWFSTPGGIAADLKKFGYGRFLAVIEVGAGKTGRARLLKPAHLRDLLPFVPLAADDKAIELAPSVEATAVRTIGGDNADAAVVDVVAGKKIGPERSDHGSLTEPQPTLTSEPAMLPAVAAGCPVQVVAATCDAEARPTPKLVLLETAQAMQARRPAAGPCAGSLGGGP